MRLNYEEYFSNSLFGKNEQISVLTHLDVENRRKMDCSASLFCSDCLAEVSKSDDDGSSASYFVKTLVFQGSLDKIYFFLFP